MKRLFAILLSLSMLLACASTGLAEDEAIKVYVNGEELQTEAYVKNDRTMVPLRAITEALQCDVYWNEGDAGITIFDGMYLYMMWADGERDIAFTTTPFMDEFVCMDVIPEFKNDRTFLPLRALTELIPRAEVSYDEETNSVSVTAEKLEEPVEAGLAEQYSIYTSMYSMDYEKYAGIAHGNANTIEAEIKIAGMDGSIKLELYPDVAPITVQNFVRLAKSGVWKDKIFHRVIEGFMIQGGAFDEYDNGFSTDPISGEFAANNVWNMLSHKRGVISMARTNDPNSASNQFFICHEDAMFLDGSYAAFGKVTSGMELVDAIATTKTDDNDMPLDMITISEITITAGGEDIDGTGVNVSELMYDDSGDESWNPDPTLEEVAATLGMTYAEFVAEGELDASQVSKTMTLTELYNILPVTSYIKLFYGGSYADFLNDFDIKQSEIGPETTIAEVIRLLEKRYAE